METKELNEHMVKYGKIFTLLIVLTMITFLQPLFITFEIKGIFVAQMIIASAKAFLILAFFMHLRDSSILTKTIVLCAGVTLSIFFVIVGIDSNMDDSANDMFIPKAEHHIVNKGH
jgi:caa(3)-type oxidase subunit IV